MPWDTPQTRSPLLSDSGTHDCAASCVTDGSDMGPEDNENVIHLYVMNVSSIPSFRVTELLMPTDPEVLQTRWGEVR